MAGLIFRLYGFHEAVGESGFRCKGGSGSLIRNSGGMSASTGVILPDITIHIYIYIHIPYLIIEHKDIQGL